MFSNILFIKVCLQQVDIPCRVGDFHWVEVLFSQTCFHQSKKGKSHTVPSEIDANSNSFFSQFWLEKVDHPGTTNICHRESFNSIEYWRESCAWVKIFKKLLRLFSTNWRQPSESVVQIIHRYDNRLSIHSYCVKK